VRRRERETAATATTTATTVTTATKLRTVTFETHNDIALCVAGETFRVAAGRSAVAEVELLPIGVDGYGAGLNHRVGGQLPRRDGAREGQEIHEQNRSHGFKWHGPSGLPGASRGTRSKRSELGTFFLSFPPFSGKRTYTPLPGTFLGLLTSVSVGRVLSRGGTPVRPRFVTQTGPAMSSLLKQLATGEDSCTAGAGSSRNAIGTLSDALFGGSSRLTEQTGRTDGPSTSRVGTGSQAAALRERAMAHAGIGGAGGAGGHNLVEEFLAGPQVGPKNESDMFEHVFAGQQPHQASPNPFQPEQDRVVEDRFRGFLHVNPAPQGVISSAGPPMRMSVKEQCHVRDRSTILARQLFAGRGDAFVNQHVETLLRSLNIDQHALPRQASEQRAWDGLWNKNNQTSVAVDHAAGVSSHSGLREQEGRQHPTASWAEEFVHSAEDKHVSWADEFEQQQHLAGVDRDPAIASVSTVEHTRRLAEALSAETDPKFKNSQFLQFVSKMSRGELVVDGNDVREVEQGQRAGHPQATASRSFVDEYLDTSAGGKDWAEQFSREFAADVVPETTKWVQDFVQQAEGGTWADEFSGLGSGFGSTGGYQMAPNNPFLTDVDSFAKGRQLFQQGLLTESMLAIEAECTRRPNNVDAWTLLGKVNAENDDDVQAIEAMKRGLAVDPNSLELLLSLGVAYTNEFDQKNAVGYLRRWLLTHPRYQAMMRDASIPFDSSQAVSHAVHLYKMAARESPDDADVHAALGVLCNLARQYDDAVTAFRQALRINGNDYSLWNKLGATLANSGRSGEALDAYRRALEAKPNYMRGWTNMGISLANLGKYEESGRYYCRALSLNRNSSSVWGYLRTSLICGAREDLLKAVDECDLEQLQRALPL